MSKLESVTIRVSAKFKALLVERARAQNRSMTSYLETLVLEEARRARRREEPKPPE